MAEFMTEHPLLKESKVASGAIIGRRFVGLDDAQAGAGEITAGVAESDAADTELFTLISYGTVVVEAGAAVLKGAEVTPDAAGKAVTAVATDYISGYALSAAAADGDMIEIRLGALPVKG